MLETVALLMLAFQPPIAPHSAFEPPAAAAAASGVNARSLLTMSAIIVRFSGVVPKSTTFTNRDARSSFFEMSTASA